MTTYILQGLLGDEGGGSLRSHKQEAHIQPLQPARDCARSKGCHQGGFALNLHPAYASRGKISVLIFFVAAFTAIVKKEHTFDLHLAAACSKCESGSQDMSATRTPRLHSMMKS